MRRPNNIRHRDLSASKYLPCKYCYGMFKKKYLHRHFKICKHNKNVMGRNNAQSDGQNMLIAFAATDERLVKDVFPRMISDEISVIAKTDDLIKAFGTRYLKCHKEKHLISVASQKMRILARFLIAMKLEIPEITSLQNCLSPKYFDAIVKSSKHAGYKIETDKYRSPSVILKLGQSLKQCCEIPEFLILKNCNGLEDSNKEKESVNNLKYMIEKQWSFELSTNASKEINENKWNKPALLPLTADIKLFR